MRIISALLGLTSLALAGILIALDQGDFPDPLKVGDFEKGWELDLITVCLNFALAFNLAAWHPAVHVLRWKLPRKLDFRTWFTSCKWPFVFSLPLALAVMVGGGFVNRIRGGWMEISPGDDLPLRAVSCSFLGLVAALSTGRPFLLPAVWFTAYFGVIEGWGCYFGLGRGSGCSTSSRHGMFDWLLGQAGGVNQWGFTRRWLYCYSGMVLRGLAWTGPPGLLINVALRQPRYAHCDIAGQSSWLYALSGSCMGLVYALGWAIPSRTKDFEQGTALAEYMWGFWLSLCLIAACVGMPEPLEQLHSDVIHHNSNNVQSSLSRLLSLESEEEEEEEARGCVVCGGVLACSWPACAPFYRPRSALRPCVGWALVRAFLTALVLAVLLCSGGLLIEVVMENRIVHPLPWKY